MHRTSLYTIQVQSFLNAACVELGFCLPPQAQRNLIERPTSSAGEFVTAVISAEGLDPSLGGKEYFKPLMKLYHKHVV